MMHLRNLFIAGVFVVFLLLVIYHSPDNQLTTIHAQPDTALNDNLSNDDGAFERVLQPRDFTFPEDHGAHNRYRTEWWYFTGNVMDHRNRKFGYELTFFRYALSAEPDETTIKPSPWRSNQLYMAHFAITDVVANKFYYAERFSRAANGLAGAKNTRFHVWLFDWSASAADNSAAPIRLLANSDDFAIDLQLVASKPIAFQGDRGYSKKNQQAGNASYYYSLTRLATTGTIRIANSRYSVSGSSWMDREWSTSSLASGQSGWDWFALQLSDNTELMFYRFRRKDGKPDANSSGAIFAGYNSKMPLTLEDVSIDILGYWQSPHSDISYPSGWHISIPGQEIELDVLPLIKDQELNTRFRYWEGAVAISGTRKGNKVSGQGYVELTGYRVN